MLTVISRLYLGCCHERGAFRRRQRLNGLDRSIHMTPHRNVRPARLTLTLLNATPKDIHSTAPDKTTVPSTEHVNTMSEAVKASDIFHNASTHAATDDNSHIHGRTQPNMIRIDGRRAQYASIMA